jgi:hypothetical protein
MLPLSTGAGKANEPMGAGKADDPMLSWPVSGIT